VNLTKQEIILAGIVVMLILIFIWGIDISG